MKQGLFFGSFNPIHVGHLIIAQYFLNNSDLEKIHCIVSPHNPLKEKSQLLEAEKRLEWVEKALEGQNNILANDIEFEMPQPSFTIETITKLKELNPDIQYIIITGSDSIAQIKLWKHYEKILAENSIYVYERPGYSIDIQHFKSHNIHLFKTPLLEISSSYIRELIQKELSIRFLVPEIIEEEVKQYYQNL
jgi:nicotinate-nucleotide adenylyltransferase